MMRLRGIVTLLVLVCLLMGFSQDVRADTVPTSEPLHWEYFIGGDGQLWGAATYQSFQVMKLDEKGLIENGINGCLKYTVWVEYYTFIPRILVAKYTQEISWCFTGSTITSVTRKDWPNVYGLFLVWKGRINQYIIGGPGQYSYEAFSQGWFCYVDYNGSCFWHIYPWIDQTVTGSGSYYGSGGY